MKQVIVLGSLLTVSLVGSYLTYTQPDAPSAADQEKVAMYRAEVGDLQKLVWKGDDLTIELEKKKDDRGEYTWVTTTELVPVHKEHPPAPEADDESPEGDDAAASDTDAPAAPEPEAAKETKITAFKGNEAAEKLWAGFAPLLALRELETNAATDASVFGLDAPKATLEVVRANGTLTLPVGGETWGSKDRYVGLDGKVYLVDDADLRPLQYGKTRLVERNLQPLAEADIEGVEVTKDGKSAAFVQKNKEDRAKAFWARDGAEAEDEAGSTWLDKLMRMRVQSYVDDKDAPALEPVMTYVISGKGERWTVEVLREAGAANPEYFAKSGFDRSLVKLTKSLASEAVADADTVLAPAPAP